MEFRKMVTITLYTRQQKRHWCIEQAYGLCGRGWEDLGEWHWNMWNVMYETKKRKKSSQILDSEFLIVIKDPKELLFM